MNRRNFLVNLLLWILSFFIGYTIKKNLNDQLSQIATDISDYGAVANGSDITQKFISACNSALLQDVPLELNNGTYLLNLTSDINVPSIIGNGSKLIINGDYSLLFTDNFRSIGVTFETNNVRAKTVTAYGNPLLKSKNNNVKNIGLIDTIFVANGTADGITKAGIAFKGQTIDGLYLNNVQFTCFRQCVNVAYGKSNNIKADNVRFYNVETGFYIGGSDTNSSVQDYAKDISLSKITHINSTTQMQNFVKMQGSDTILLEKCEGVSISKVYAENIIERCVYANCVKNIHCDDFMLLDTEGIKFVGRVRYDTGLETYAENCHASNIRQKMITKDERLVFETYWSKNVHLNDFSVIGGSVNDVCMTLRHSVDDFTLNGLYVENIKRAVVQYIIEGTIVALPGSGIPINPEGNYPAYLKNVTIKNVKAKNVCQLGYHVFRVIDSGTPLTTGNYRIFNLKLEDITVQNYDTDNCKGLFDLNNINGLRVKNCKLHGFKSDADANGTTLAFPFQVGSNSKNIIISHEEIFRTADKKFVLGNLYASPGTELKYRIIERQRMIEDVGVIKPLISSNATVDTVNLLLNYILQGHLLLKSNSADSIISIVGIDSAGTYPLANIIGNVDVVTDSGKRATFNITTGNTVALQTGADTTVFDTAGVSTKLSVTKSSSTQAILLRDKRNTGATSMVDYYITSSYLEPMIH